MKEILIGRQREREDLQSWIDSDRSEFIAIYGRRRVGKTFLVKQTIPYFTFNFSGSYGLNRKQQLLNFGLALRLQFDKHDLSVPENWVMAFHLLKQLVDESPHDKKINIPR